MLKSMTAFGRASIELSFGVCSIEIQSVNRRFLEVQTSLSRDLSRFDVEIKKQVNMRLNRGQVFVKIYFKALDAETVNVLPNLQFAKQLKRAWDQVADALGLEKEKAFSLGLIKNEIGLFQYEDQVEQLPEIKKLIFQALGVALDNLDAMKVLEGEALQSDIVKRTGYLKESVDIIEQKKGGAEKRYKERILQKLKDLRVDEIENDERVLKEICLFADKVDITEELIRIRSHLDQWQNGLMANEAASGKKLEFLVQELLREINTIAAKSSDIEISKAVINFKTDLERIREQLQNVE